MISSWSWALLCLFSVAAAAEEPPSAYRVYTYAGPAVADSVPALSTNIRATGVAQHPDGSLVLATYTAEGFVRMMNPDGLIWTIGGKMVRDGLENEGGLALETDLGQVVDVAVDSLGNVYLTSSWDVILKIRSDGSITRVAGTWDTPGFSGDGGLAVDATLEYPWRLLILPDGSILVSVRRRVRRIRPDGIIETIAGNGSDERGGVGDGGLAVDAALPNPQGMARDAEGRIYIADPNDERVRRINLDGTIETVAGIGGFGEWGGDGGSATEAQIGDARDLLFDEAGNLYIADSANGLIRRVDSEGIITTYAGTGTRGYSGDGGPAIEAQIGRIQEIEWDDNGNMLIVDDSAFRIRSIDSQGVIRTIAGNGAQLFAGDGLDYHRACFFGPKDIAFAPNGKSYVADLGNHRIRMIDVDGIVQTIAGNGGDEFTVDGSPAVEASVVPWSLALSPEGELYFVDAAHGYGGHAQFHVRKIDTSGRLQTVVGNGSGVFNGDGILATDAGLREPDDIQFGPDGRLYIADRVLNRVRVVDGDGYIWTVCGTGELLSDGDGGPAELASVNNPGYLHINDQGEIFLTELWGNRIRRIDTNGIITTVAGTGVSGFSGDGGLATSATVSGPGGITQDRFGYVYFSDSGNNRIRRFLPGGVIETIAGTGEIGYLGEGLSALEAPLRGPLQLVMGHQDTLYVEAHLSGRLYELIPDRSTPVSWYGFQAKDLGLGGVELSWESSSTAAVHFQILRQQFDPVRERTLAVLDGLAPGHFSYLDPAEGLTGAVEYRVEVTRAGEMVEVLGPLQLMKNAPSGRRDANLRAYPNPFNPRTRLEFMVEEKAEVSLQIVDARGRLVRRLADGTAQGRVQLDWDGIADNGKPVTSGVYFAVLRIDGRTRDRVKLSLVR